MTLNSIEFTMKLFLSNLVGELGFECLIGKELFDWDMGLLRRMEIILLLLMTLNSMDSRKKIADLGTPYIEMNNMSMYWIYSNLVCFTNEGCKCIIHKYQFSPALSWSSVKWFRKFYHVIEFCPASISFLSIKSRVCLLEY